MEEKTYDILADLHVRVNKRNFYGVTEISGLGLYKAEKTH